MYAVYQRGEMVKRDPAIDDGCGMCAIYPPERKTVCDPNPRRGLALECGGTELAKEQKPGCTCAFGPFAGNAYGPYGLLLFWGLLGGMRRIARLKVRKK
jgi:hypothetical protein